jgi:hypothetical protein
MTFKKYFDMICKGYAIMFCYVQTFLLLFPMFMLAYSNGTMETMLRINVYGEANIEMVYWFINFPFITYGMFLILNDAFRSK